jgi:glycerophosphoryl diester phosphodiesterase
VAGQRPVLAVAHRAGNSLAGLHRANELGVDVIECDVHRHRGRLEVRHLKTAGPLPFLWDRWELASAAAPRLGLAELLEADRHGSTFMLDLKGRRTSAARAVARLLHHGGHHRPVLVCGRYWPAVEAVGALPFALPVLSARNRVELTRLRQRLEPQRDQPPGPARPVHGVSVHRSLLDAAVVSALHRSVEVVMTWPVNDLVALDRTLGLGVSGIISDEPAVLAEVIRRRPVP